MGGKLPTQTKVKGWRELARLNDLISHPESGVNKGKELAPKRISKT